MDKHTLTELEANGYLVLDDGDAGYFLDLVHRLQGLIRVGGKSITADLIDVFLKEKGLEEPVHIKSESEIRDMLDYESKAREL